MSLKYPRCKVGLCNFYGYKKRDNFLKVVSLSERERIRTFDRLLRRQMLYPAELRTH